MEINHIHIINQDQIQSLVDNQYMARNKKKIKKIDFLKQEDRTKIY